MNMRKIVIIPAIVFGALSGVLVLIFLFSLRAKHTAAMETTQVIVANQQIPPQVPLNASMFHFEQRQKASLDPDVVTSRSQLNGDVALISIPAGSVLTDSKLGPPTAAGLAVELKPGQRAISMSIDRTKSVSGLLVPGNYVDVLAEGPKINGRVQNATAIIRDVRVLSVGYVTQSPGATPSPDMLNAANITLAVTPTQATTLMTADQNATLRLALRPPTDPLRSTPIGDVVYNGNGPTQALVVPDSVPPLGALQRVASDPLPSLTTPSSGTSGGAGSAPSSDTAATSGPGVSVINGVILINGSY